MAASPMYPHSGVAAASWHWYQRFGVEVARVGADRAQVELAAGVRELLMQARDRRRAGDLDGVGVAASVSA